MNEGSLSLQNEKLIMKKKLIMVFLIKKKKASRKRVKDQVTKKSFIAHKHGTRLARERKKEELLNWIFPKARI